MPPDFLEEVVHLILNPDKLSFIKGENSNKPFYCSKWCDNLCPQLEPLIIAPHSVYQMKWDQKVLYCDKDRISGKVNIIDELESMHLSMNDIILSLSISYLLSNNQKNSDYIHYPFIIKKQLNQPENYCQKDEDCVLTNFHEAVCCYKCNNLEYEAVSKKTYENRLEWQKENCGKANCPNLACSTSRNTAVCKNNVCTEFVNEGDSCAFEHQCQNINCSKYDTPVKNGFKPDCVDDKCKCMCYGCK